MSTPIETIDEGSINALFECAADTVEESIYNVLTSAETTVGIGGLKMEGLPLDALKRLMDQHYVPVPFV